jgi:hypothetical protein
MLLRAEFFVAQQVEGCEMNGIEAAGEVGKPAQEYSETRIEAARSQTRNGENGEALGRKARVVVGSRSVVDTKIRGAWWPWTGGYSVALPRLRAKFILQARATGGEVKIPGGCVSV